MRARLTWMTLAGCLAACSSPTTRPDAGVPVVGLDAGSADGGQDAGTSDGGQDAGPSTSISITSISPTHGKAGDPFTIVGIGFAQQAQVYFGSAQASVTSVGVEGTTLLGKVPSNTSTASTVSVQVQNEPGISATLTGGFTYGAAVGIQSCKLEAPTAVTTVLGQGTPKLAAIAIAPGLLPADGDPTQLTGDVGFGDAAASLDHWSWSPAVFGSHIGDAVAFSGAVAPSQLGQFAFAFRFTLDGTNYTYCDTTGVGFSPASAGSLTVIAKPTVTSVTPTFGKAGDTVTVAGSNFGAGTTFNVGAAAASNVVLAADGSSATMTIPAGTGTVPISAVIGGVTLSVPTVTFTYAQLTNWCTLDMPTSATVFLGDTTPTLFGEVYQPGLTVGTGAGAGVTAQLGYGLDSVRPEMWTWTSAKYAHDGGPNNNNDVYSGTLTPTALGTLRFAYRFSIDGVSYLYCTTADPSQPFDPKSAGTLTVLQKPTITDVEPQHAKAGDTVKVTGSNLVSGLTFTFGGAVATQATFSTDGASATVTVPAGSGAVAVTGSINGYSTLWTGMFTYDVFVKSCQLDSPLNVQMFVGDTSPALLADVTSPGQTPGGSNGLVGQVGFGPSSTPPAMWTWSNAAYAKDNGMADVFSGAITTALSGTWSFAYRFTADGRNYSYCDGSGSANGFVVGSAGTLSVLNKPTLTNVQPAHAKIGDTVTVTGTNLAAGTVFTFGNAVATATTLSANGSSATVTVPSGSGSVAVSATLNGYSVLWSGMFSYDVPANPATIGSTSPAFLPIAGGTLTINGANFDPTTASVTIGGQAASLATGVGVVQSSTQLIVNAPSVAAGTKSIVVVSGGAMATTTIDYVLKFTITPDGDLSDWPALAKVATDSTTSEWGSNGFSDVLRELYLGYDNTNLYIGIRGQTEAANAIIGYLSLSDVAWGSANIAATLTDNTGVPNDNGKSVDAMLSSGFSVTAPGFLAQYGFGVFGDSTTLTNSISNSVGVRGFSTPSNFDWVNATVARLPGTNGGVGTLEIAIPWSASGPGGSKFESFPTSPVTVQLFTRIVSCSGMCFPSESLPGDPDLQSTDATVRAKVSAVSSFEIR
jgi:hypothetical protein